MSVAQFGKIGVLMGGFSSEREISLRSGQGVANALTAKGHQVCVLDIQEPDKDKIIAQIKDGQIEVAFIALHGRGGEDGFIQSILEDMDIPYTGSGVRASQIAFNKTLTQRALKQAGLPVPAHVIIENGAFLEFKVIWDQLKSTPIVVKAACEGSSIGVYVVRHPSEWEPALKNACAFGPNVIVEQFIKGREFTVGIFDQEALPVVEIIPKSNFFDFNSKYQKGMTQYAVPAILEEGIAKKIQALALRAHEVLGCQGFSRVDFRLDQKQKPFILEINTIPGFTETSLFPKAAAVAGYDFVAVCEKLLELAYGKKIKH